MQESWPLEWGGRNLSNVFQSDEILDLRDFRDYLAHLWILQMHTLRPQISSQYAGKNWILRSYTQLVTLSIRLYFQKQINEDIDKCKFLPKKRKLSYALGEILKIHQNTAILYGCLNILTLKFLISTQNLKYPQMLLKRTLI